MKLKISKNGKILLNCLDNNITEANLPNEITIIGKGAFKDCISLKSINLSESVTKIGNDAFKGCISLQSVNIKKNVTEIIKGAFKGCKSLINIRIPQKTTKIGKGVFTGCTLLQSIEVCPSNQFYTSINGVLLNKEQTTIIKYPPMKNDNEYSIPNGITKIEYDAFQDCISLESVHIPESITRIPRFVFSGCTLLQYIHIKIIDIDKCYINYNAFNGINKENIVLYVPEERYLKYKNHPVFGQFKNIEIEKQE